MSPRTRYAAVPLRSRMIEMGWIVGYRLRTRLRWWTLLTLLSLVSLNQGCFSTQLIPESAPAGSAAPSSPLLPIFTPTPSSGLSTQCGWSIQDSTTRNQLPAVKLDILVVLPIGTTSYTFRPEVCDPDGKITRYLWFTNTNVGESFVNRDIKDATVTQLKPGNFQFSLVVTDNLGGQTKARAQLFIPAEATPQEIQAGIAPHQGYLAEQAAIVTQPKKTPIQSHPRYLGSNRDLALYHAPLDQMPCGLNGKPSTYGNVFSIKNVWDTYRFGSSPCQGAKLTTDPATHPVFKCFVGTGCSWKFSTAMNALYLLRRLEDCHAQNSGTCQFNSSQVKSIRQAIYHSSVAHFKANMNLSTCPAGTSLQACSKSKGWNLGYAIFDLFSEEPISFWSLFFDVYWDEIATADRTTILASMNPIIDGWLGNQQALHWAYANGNNWSPVQARALIMWAIVFYHEDPRSKAVLKSILDTLWLHRDFYLAEGYYIEGQSYASLSFDPIRDIHRAIRLAFGASLQSVKWEYLKKLTPFYLDYIGTDGRTIDFGDSWIKRGFGTFNPLYSFLVDEMLGLTPLGSTPIPPCVVREFYSNKYYDHGFGSGWSIDPVLARDWEAIASQCSRPTVASGTERVSFLKFGGNASFRVWMPGATQQATQPMTTSASWYYHQADQTYLAIESSSSAFPHRELDFGSLTWTAFGVRFLSDWGYGKIVNSSVPYDMNTNPDFLPSGHNTLYVPEQMAVDAAGKRVTNTDMSQFWKIAGKSDHLVLQNRSVIFLDGSDVYGANQQHGLTQHYYRWVYHAGSGHYVVADWIKMKPGVTSKFQESFYFHARRTTDATTCNVSSDSSMMHIHVSLPSANRLDLSPACNPLNLWSSATATAEAKASITGWSLQAGKFILSSALPFITNLMGGEDRRSFARWMPNTALNEDLRVFVLASGATNSPLPQVAMSRMTDACPLDSTCVNVVIGNQTQRLEFKSESGKMSLHSIQ